MIYSCHNTYVQTCYPSVPKNRKNVYTFIATSLHIYTHILPRGLCDLLITTYKLQTADSVLKHTVTKRFENVTKSTSKGSQKVPKSLHYPYIIDTKSLQNPSKTVPKRLHFMWLFCDLLVTLSRRSAKFVGLLMLVAMYTPLEIASVPMKTHGNWFVGEGGKPTPPVPVTGMLTCRHVAVASFTYLKELAWAGVF